jgi:hypothetical protein
MATVWVGGEGWFLSAFSILLLLPFRQVTRPFTRGRTANSKTDSEFFFPVCINKNKNNKKRDI